MKRTLCTLLILVASAATSSATGRLIPAGSIIQCTVAEPKLSSKTAAPGDPILCRVGYERFGRWLLPYDTYLSGRFEDYRDPGRLVGKGWMQLVFDRVVIEPSTILPLNARVVDVPGYRVDHEGRVLGKGHTGRDIAEWMIPILWPIDLINLPRRGPRPALKSEARITLKVMDDFLVPSGEQLQQDPSGLLRRAPSAYTVPPAQTDPPNDLLADVSIPPATTVAATEWYVDQPTRLNTPWGSSSVVRHVRMPYPGTESREAVTLIFRDGRPPEQIRNYMLTPTNLYIFDSYRRIVPLSQVDMAATRRANQGAGVDFRLPTRSSR